MPGVEDEVGVDLLDGGAENKTEMIFWRGTYSLDVVKICRSFSQATSE